MKGFLPFALIIIVMFSFIGLGLSKAGAFGCYIDQDLKSCSNNGLMQVRTYVWCDLKIIYSSRTWRGDDSSCLPIDSISIVKEREYQKAEYFITQFEKVK